MEKKEKLHIVKDFINKNGKLLTVNNGSQLELDETVKETNKEWYGSTVDVVVIGEGGCGTAYFHKGNKLWFLSGLAPFDVPFCTKTKRELVSPKFITSEQFKTIQFK